MSIAQSEEDGRRESILSAKYGDSIIKYKITGERLEEFLTHALEGIAVVVTGRKKSLDSLQKKFLKKSEEGYKYNNAFGLLIAEEGQLQAKESPDGIYDLYGIRILAIVPGTQQHIMSRIKKRFKEESVCLETPEAQRGNYTIAYEKNVKRGGYEGRHLMVYDKNGVPVELQIRDLFQHAWAELEHVVRYESRRDGSKFPPMLRDKIDQMSVLTNIAAENLSQYHEDGTKWKDLMSHKNVHNEDEAWWFLSQYLEPSMIKRSGIPSKQEADNGNDVKSFKNYKNSTYQFLIRVGVRDYEELHELLVDDELVSHIDCYESKLNNPPGVLRHLYNLFLLAKREDAIAAVNQGLLNNSNSTAEEILKEILECKTT